MTGCDKCQGKAAYTRKYSGQRLCAKCFTDSIARKTAKTISKYGMIKSGQLVAVAVSGGKDSLALLDMMKQMSDSHNFAIKAVTVDEGIPGYRDEALGLVQNFCSTLGVEHDILSYKDLFDLTLDDALTLRGDSNVSSCSICGTLRRRALDHAAAHIGADSVATGHNLDDMLQTFLINMLSGDTKKIGWMDPDSRGLPRRIKPFCEIYEAEIVFYAFVNNIPFQAEPCPHTDEGIRTEIRSFLNSLEDKHSGIKNSLYRSILKVSQAVKREDSMLKAPCKRCGSPCTGGVCSVCSIVSSLAGKT